MVDCGDGVARQLVLAGIPLRSVRGVFITHHHSDHDADYISGDTTPPENLVALARNADVLVHEALYDAAAVDRLVAGVPNAPDLRRSILSHHTTAVEAGRLAADARVGTVVLSHLVPAEDATITDEMWRSAAQTHFSGRVVVGKDLMEL